MPNIFLSIMETVADNVGISLENIVLLVVVLGGFVFYAKDFRLGVVIHFIMMGATFMWFYAAGFNFGTALLLFFMFLILMAFTLFGYRTERPVGVI